MKLRLSLIATACFLLAYAFGIMPLMRQCEPHHAQPSHRYRYLSWLSDERLRCTEVGMMPLNLRDQTGKVYAVQCAEASPQSKPPKP